MCCSVSHQLIRLRVASDSLVFVPCHFCQTEWLSIAHHSVSSVRHLLCNIPLPSARHRVSAPSLSTFFRDDTVAFSGTNWFPVCLVALPQYINNNRSYIHLGHPRNTFANIHFCTSDYIKGVVILFRICGIEEQIYREEVAGKEIQNTIAEI